MKLARLCLIASALTTFSASAARYEKILTCDGAHIDVNADERKQLQLVVTDQAALKYLNDFRYGNGQYRIVSLPFGAQEYVVSGDVNTKVDFQAEHGPKIRFPRDARGVFQPGDFDYFIKGEIGFASYSVYSYVSEHTFVGGLTTVYRRGSDVVLQYASLKALGCSVPTKQTTDCGGEGGGYCPRTICPSVEKTRFDFVTDYTFHNCR